MNRKFVGLLGIFAMLPMMAFAQGRGAGGPGGGQRGGQPQTQTRGQGRVGQGMGQGQMDRDRIRQELHTHATDQQRDRLRDCTQDMDRLRTQSRDMLNATSAKGFNAENARQQRERLQQQFEATTQAHHRFMNSLDKEQQQAMQSRARNMDQLQSRIRTRLETMNKELRAESPSRKRLQEQARYVERETQRMQNQYRDMGEDLSLTED